MVLRRAPEMSVMPPAVVRSLLLGAAFAAVACTPVVAQIAPLPDPTPPPNSIPNAGPGWLGVFLGNTAGPNGGVIVQRVVPESAAERAGLRAGAEVVAVQGTPVFAPAEFIARVGVVQAGGTVTLTLLDGTTLTAVLDPRPQDINAIARRLVGRPAPPATVVALPHEIAGPIFADDGRVRVVEFWATWCGPCHANMPRLQALRARIPTSQLDIVGITDETPAEVAPFMRRYTPTWRVASDPEREANDSWWVVALPTFFVVSADGTVLSVHAGADAFAELEVAVDAALRAAAPMGANREGSAE